MGYAYVKYGEIQQKKNIYIYIYICKNIVNGQSLVTKLVITLLNKIKITIYF